MAQTQQTRGFNFKSMNWEDYTRYRAPYPRKVYDIVFAHHKKAGGQYHAGLDIGAGNGAVTAELLQQFERVIFNDLQEDYIHYGVQRFNAVPPQRLSFLSGTWDNLTPGTEGLETPLDIVTACTCLHFCDADYLIPRLAKLLRPGGTFAAWTYAVHAIFPRNHPAHAVFERIFAVMLQGYASTVEGLSVSSAPAKWTSRYNFIPFDPAEWKNVRRIQACMDHVMIHPDIPSASSRVAVGETIEFLEDNLCTVDADFEWVRGHLINQWPSLDLAQICKNDFDELKAKMGQDLVKLVFPMSIVIATKS